MSKTLTKTLVTIIALLGFFLIPPQKAMAKEEFSRVVAEGPRGGEIDLGHLSEGESIEMEFRFVDLMKKEDGECVTDMVFNVMTQDETDKSSFNEKMIGNFIDIKKVGNRWCSYFHPCRCVYYSRNYFLDINFNETGLNNLKVSFKNKWVTFRLNNKLIGAIPNKSKTTILNWGLANAVLDYRWIRRPGKRGALIPQVMDVQGGGFFDTPTLFELKDGSHIRLFITPLHANKHPDWESLLAVTVGDSATWFRPAGENTFTASLEIGGEERDIERLITLTTGKESYIDVKRQKNKVLIFINDKFLASYVHKPGPGTPDPWGVHFRASGYKLNFRVQKIK